MRQSISAFVLCLLAGPSFALGQASRIHVGPNVLVSRGQAGEMREILLSADPVDPGHLLGCGIAHSRSKERVLAYLSTDGGKTWRQTLRTPEDAVDPACAQGRNGLAILVVMQTFPNQHVGDPPQPRFVLAVYRSTDGGKTWPRPENLPMNFQGIDRDSIAIDTTGGKYDGTVYVSGTSAVGDLAGGRRNGFGVWVSHDGGRTFAGPLRRADANGHYVLDTGNDAILSDGTLVSLFGDLKRSDGRTVAGSTPGDSNSVLLSVRTTDGGDFLSEAAKVANFYMINIWALHQNAPFPPSHSSPTLAVDPSIGPFKDRLYAVWTDNRDGRGAVRFSYSADDGQTWSKSVAIDDVPGPVSGQAAPDNSQPTVAVNKAGVVLVTWYDRRDSPDGLGWYIRARASLDGGQAWLPSVRVSTEPNVFTPQTRFFVQAGSESPNVGAPDSGSVDPIRVSVRLDPHQFLGGADYSGLAADASGTFHGFWIDDRTGIPEIWTAPIVVDGTAVANGSLSLAHLKDVSPDVKIEIVSSDYDRASGTVTMRIQLRNTSTKTIHAPIELRLLNLSSFIGTPSVANSDNGAGGPGALWDLSTLLKGGLLEPKQSSGTMQLVFRVSDPRPFFNGKVVRTLDLLNFDARLLAASQGAGKPMPLK